MFVELTKAAARKVYDLFSDESHTESEKPCLRVSIKGGGCSGFSYCMQLDDYPKVTKATEKQTKDEQDEQDGLFSTLITVQESQVLVYLSVDSLSLTYLSGATIDYRSDLHGEQFVIQNPNAKTRCGCGSSFSV